jgi:uncharacterized membrane protein YhaH (DUF805 family)
MHPGALAQSVPALVGLNQQGKLPPMSAKAPPPSDRILRAILSIIFSVLCFSVLNAMSKTLSQTYPVIEVIWGRYVFAFIFMMAIFLPRAGLALFRWHNVPSQIVRGLLLFLSSFLYFHGIVDMPLASAASISLTSPLIVTRPVVEFPGRAGRAEALGRRHGRLRRRLDRRAAGLGALRMAFAVDRRQHDLELALPTLLAALRAGRAARCVGHDGHDRRHRGRRCRCCPSSG